jgi:AcrR family transcriptional regulator
MILETKHKPSTLRSRQKQTRNDAVISAARELFLQKGYATATIEMIADKAFVSAPTIYNYFKTKERLLLAVIRKCDEEIITVLNQSIEHPKLSAEKEIANFLILVNSSSLNHLDPKTWQQAYANIVLDPNAEISSGYIDLNNELYNGLENLLNILLRQGKLPDNTDIPHVRYLFQRLNHALFGEIISDRGISLSQYRKIILSYVRLIISGIT